MFPAAAVFQAASKHSNMSAGGDMSNASASTRRYGIILAAGEGKRLQPLVQRLRGDTLPKQYVSFIGRRSVLEHTFARVEQVVPRERIFTVISQDHLRYPTVVRQLSRQPKGTVLTQPENKDTGPGILLPLMHLYKRDPECMVAVFPSDHFVLEEDLFMSHVSFAFQVVERNPALLVLLAVQPSEIEPEYGYVMPHGDEAEKPLGLSIRRVSRFIEKPSRDAAREMIFKGGLWNTMVMVFKVKTLVDIAREYAAELYGPFEEIMNTIGTRKEKSKTREIYRELKGVNFSREILEMLPLYRPSCLSVLAVRNVLWSDWGLPRSIERVLRQTGHLERLYTVDETSASRLCGIFSDSVESERESPWGAARNGVNQSPVVPEAFKRFAPGPVLTPDG
jgi:mannose-1-phosphate guanylyltransferase